jgi:hypothetical protein
MAVPGAESWIYYAPQEGNSLQNGWGILPF